MNRYIHNKPPPLQAAHKPDESAEQALADFTRFPRQSAPTTAPAHSHMQFDTHSTAISPSATLATMCHRKHPPLVRASQLIHATHCIPLLTELYVQVGCGAMRQ